MGISALCVSCAPTHPPLHNWTLLLPNPQPSLNGEGCGATKHSPFVKQKGASDLLSHELLGGA